MVDLEEVADETNADIAISFKVKDERYSKVLDWGEINPIEGTWEILESDEIKGYRYIEFNKYNGKIIYEERNKLNGESI
ncbi:MAG: hypothetical protein AABY15_00655 [Nanoarchaeota archaeon]